MARVFGQTVRTTSTPFDLRPVRVYTASRDITEGDGTLVADTTGGDITFTLPTAALCEGRMYVVVKKVAANLLTIVPSGVDTIGYEGLLTFSLSALDEQISLLSGGSENVWYLCECGSAAAAAPSFDFAWHTRLTTAGGSFAVTNAAQYLMIGTTSSPAIGKATIGDAQHRIPREVELTAIYVRLTAALTGTQVLTCKINVNGTADGTITVTHNSGTGTLASATGSIVIPQDALVCYEFGFSGGLTTTNLNGVTAAYTLQSES